MGLWQIQFLICRAVITIECSWLQIHELLQFFQELIENVRSKLFLQQEVITFDFDKENLVEFLTQIKEEILKYT